MAPRPIVILGSTGSIGESALEVVAAHRNQYRVVGLAAGRGWRRLAQQAVEFDVAHVALADVDAAQSLRGALPGGGQLLAGPEALVELIRDTDADLVLSAVVGAAGLPATMAAVERGIDVALANKESLVVAGSILMPLARKTGSKLIPVDSEHSAIFQSLQSGAHGEVHKLTLTASGGPFRAWTHGQIQDATLEDALRHPTWSMGPKITIDSASMMNKALEVIEAHYLFDMPADRIEVLVHPQSIVHSMVEFCDGSVIAQLGAPDMKTPIQYALSYPRRHDGIAERLNLAEVGRLDFEPPDFERFPLLGLGFDAARRGGTSGAVLNAANEAAVACFREGKFRFGRLADVVGEVCSRHDVQDEPSLADLMDADAWARREVLRCI